MKYAQTFIYTVALVVTSEYFSSCHGQLTSVDCGNSSFWSTTKATVTERRMSLGKSDVSSMIRRLFSSTFTRLNICIRAMNVTEIQIASSQTNKMTYVVEFSLDMSHLENMTNAKLTFYMTSPDDTQEEQQQVKLPLQVRGILAGYIGSMAKGPTLEEDNDFTGDEYRGAMERSFNALNFFQRVVQHVKNKSMESSIVNQEAEGSQKITVKFYITRNCACEDTSVKCCSTLVDSSIHTPSLRIYYV